MIKLTAWCTLYNYRITLSYLKKEKLLLKCILREMFNDSSYKEAYYANIFNCDSIKPYKQVSLYQEKGFKQIK